ncbi:hypothetical protein [Mycobacterium paraffinicum]|uniref:Uncharacterized protein n=1 Tax=Mycobacterium paraffinicum TaxID=53378 RepID=A0ABP8RAF0_9MYCO|nr:hypothetical protein [Mycobacterium paraffinicum]MCV7311380.1 hypothetical protein [Mycobacterium paraffinicum]
MAFVVTQRFHGRTGGRGRALLRSARLLAGKVHARTTLTPQERANMYVSRMPIAVVTASLGGHASTGNRR